MLDVDLGMLELDAPCSFVVTTGAAAVECASLPASSGAVSVFPLPVKSEPNASAQQCQTALQRNKQQRLCQAGASALQFSSAYMYIYWCKRRRVSYCYCM